MNSIVLVKFCFVMSYGAFVLKVEAWECADICTHLLSHVQFQPQKPKTCSISDICNEPLIEGLLEVCVYC